MFNHFRGRITSLELIPSTGGVFEVTVNGEKRYSKLETGEFPNVEEFIVEMEKM
ncbi:MAG TPA: SelT/SelW/SelH family protein [Bacillus bacterium]|nr:SelT/SelW/SelH family protein [Bacillus sp. (in: firmicutes)]